MKRKKFRKKTKKIQLKIKIRNFQTFHAHAEKLNVRKNIAVASIMETNVVNFVFVRIVKIKDKHIMKTKDFKQKLKKKEIENNDTLTILRKIWIWKQNKISNNTLKKAMDRENKYLLQWSLSQQILLECLKVLDHDYLIVSLYFDFLIFLINNKIIKLIFIILICDLSTKITDLSVN